ncbi:MAG: helix-turn-helix domain-containing protein [Oscillospiraceae bacterium]|jgi:transcriptional regulator with XRE-family HTH domain|nr:helix-turn-helix domain-containing protein [Oscillospiraceae bacterium]
MNTRIAGNIIKRLREKKGLSQEVLSGLADINRSYLSRVELGKSSPSLEVLYRLADALDVKMSDMLREIEKETK